MRLIALTVAAALMSATAALAAPATVSISIAPDLQKTFAKSYGEREARLLTGDLAASIRKALARTGAHDGARIELTLVDVKPNRPTFKQLGDVPGLSMQSFGVGGAALEGVVTDADGRQTPIAYRWYETDIRQSYAHWVWSDAEFAFDRFARKLAAGDQFARR
jgi:hypothetical protein